MSGIIGSKLNIRGSGLVGSLGTDGQHLLSSGAGKTNVFETATSAAGLTKITKTTVSGTSTSAITFDSSSIDSTYDNYRIIGYCKPITDSAEMRLRYLDSGDSAISTSAYYWWEGEIIVNNNAVLHQDQEAEEIELANYDVGNQGDEGQQIDGYLYSFNDSAVPSSSYFRCLNTNQFGGFLPIDSYAKTNASQQDYGVTFYLTSGNFQSGSHLTLYGIAK
jgi:hypothetical protein